MKSQLLMFAAICMSMLSMNFILLSVDCVKQCGQDAACMAKCLTVKTEAPVPVKQEIDIPGIMKSADASRIANCMNMGNTYGACR